MPGTSKVGSVGPFDPAPDQPFERYSAGTREFFSSKIPTPAAAYPNSLLTDMTEMPFVHLNVVKPWANKRTEYALGLPFPASVKVSYNANWDTIDLGAFFGGITEYARANNMSFMTDSGDVNWSNIGDAAGNSSLSAGVRNMGRKLDEFTDSNLYANVEVASRIQVNPHAALRFVGMSFREFILDFVLLPKNEIDSQQIEEIIFQIKYAMHPDASNVSGGGGGTAALSSYFSYPHEFIIGFYAPNLKYLFRTSPCELISCSVEYNGAGVPAFFRNDKPVCVLLSLHFRESEILTKKRIQQGW